MPTQIADIIVPEIFSAYIAENSLVSTALSQSGVLVRNNLMEQHLRAGAPLALCGEFLLRSNLRNFRG